MAKFIAALIATLTLFGAPAAYASQAAHPTHPTHPSKHQGDHEHSMTTYTLRGTVVSYGPAFGFFNIVILPRYKPDCRFN